MPKMLTVEQVAERFNKDTSTIARWIREGHFPGARKTGPGKTSPYVIPEDSVTALETKLTQKPAA